MVWLSRRGRIQLGKPHHCHRDPIRLIGSIREFDVVARIDELIVQRNAADAVGISDLRGDQNRCAGDRLLGMMLDLSNLRRIVRGEDGVSRAGSRAVRSRARNRAQTNVEETIAAPAQKDVL